MAEKIQKLLIVTDYFYPHWTGIAKSLQFFVKELQGDFNITILTTKNKKNLSREDSFFGAKVIREPYLFIISRSCYSVSILFRFVALLLHTDIVFVNSPSANMLFFSFLAKCFGKRLVIFHQGDLILPKGVINRLIVLVFKVSAYLSCVFADRVCTYARDYARHSYVLKPFLYKFQNFLMPLDINTFFEDKKKTKVDATIHLGFAGRFVEEKGFDILFKAIPEIKKKLPNARFFFAGEVNMNYENFFEKKSKLYEKVKKDIKLMGLLNERQMKSFYNKIDFLIVPSRSDAHNMVQTEGMLSGVPSITANIPGLRFLPKKTGFGILFEKENSSDLADKVLQAVKTKKQLLSNFQNVRKLFNKKKNLSVIKKVLVN